MRKKLPSLSALPAFEAAARLRSFTRAAEELNVTQAAISSQIRTLEDNLGIQLFIREHRKITLTEAGQQFQHAVSVALGLVSNAAEKLRSNAGTSGQTIAADASMAHLWLLPRLPEFTLRFPDISVNILTTDNELGFIKGEVNLVLLYGDGDWVGYDATLLFPEAVFPVCSPAYLAQHPEVKTPEGLAQAQLLDLKGERWDWVDWRQWLITENMPTPDKIRIMGFNNLPLMLQAARQGQGVGLGWETLVERYLKDGTLVRLFDIPLETGRGYYVIKRAGIRMSADTQVLYEWILAQDNGRLVQ